MTMGGARGMPKWWRECGGMGKMGGGGWGDGGMGDGGWGLGQVHLHPRVPIEQTSRPHTVRFIASVTFEVGMGLLA